MGTVGAVGGVSGGVGGVGGLDGGDGSESGNEGLELHGKSGKFDSLVCFYKILMQQDGMGNWESRPARPFYTWEGERQERNTRKLLPKQTPLAIAAVALCNREQPQRGDMRPRREGGRSLRRRERAAGRGWRRCENFFAVAPQNSAHATHKNVAVGAGLLLFVCGGVGCPDRVVRGGGGGTTVMLMVMMER